MHDVPGTNMMTLESSSDFLTIPASTIGSFRLPDNRAWLNSSPVKVLGIVILCCCVLLELGSCSQLDVCDHVQFMVNLCISYLHFVTT
jgi:hypothetical protein